MASLGYGSELAPQTASRETFRGSYVAQTNDLILRVNNVIDGIEHAVNRLDGDSPPKSANPDKVSPIAQSFANDLQGVRANVEQIGRRLSEIRERLQNFAG